MVYATYDYYVGTYYGQTSEPDFNRLSVRASSYLDYITLGKAAKNADLDAVKMACCALIDAYSGVEKAQEAASKSLDAMQGSELQSQTVGSWSRTYRSGADTASGALSTAAEIEAEEDCFTVYTTPDDFNAVADALTAKGYQFASAQIEMVPQNYVKLSPEDAEKMEKMLDLFDDDDDVQNTWHNWDQE